MPRAVDGTVSVPNTFSPHTVASSAQVNQNHADAAQVAETVWRNLFIGGDFTVNPWQRGTSFTGISTGAYSADRWRVDANAAVVDVLKTADAPTIAQAGIRTAHCLHIDVTTAKAVIAAGDFFLIGQRIEGLNSAVLGFGQSGARSATLSFWVKSPKTGVHCVAIRNAGEDRSYVAEYTVLAANTWERKTITIPGDTTGTWAETNSLGIQVTWALAAGSTFQAAAGAWTAGNFMATANQVNCLDDAANNFKLALCQLEMGGQARPFDVRSFEETLLRCERFYQKSFAVGAAPAQNAGAGSSELTWPSTIAGANTVLSHRVLFRPLMRGGPAMTLYNPAAANAQVRNLTDGADLSASAAANVTSRGFHVSATATAGTAVGEQLGVHWTADAEL